MLRQFLSKSLDFEHQVQSTYLIHQFHQQSIGQLMIDGLAIYILSLSLFDLGCYTL